MKYEEPIMEIINVEGNVCTDMVVVSGSTGGGTEFSLDNLDNVF